MLKPRALRVPALTGASVSTSVVPGVMRARKLTRKSGERSEAMEMAMRGACRMVFVSFSLTTQLRSVTFVVYFILQEKQRERMVFNIARASLRIVKAT
jgi:hypothetical protein